MTQLAGKTVGVMGSGKQEHDDHASLLGNLLARLGVNLLSGGGGGVMRAVSRAFTSGSDRRGICIGVIPCASETNRVHAKENYPNEYVELAIRTHLPHSGAEGLSDLSRNHINILSSNAVVALPGEEGTAAELSLAIRYGVPAVIFALDPELVRKLPESVTRLHEISEVEQFLSTQLGLERKSATGQITGIDHVQLAMPAAAEAAAREFYCGLLGLREVPKPAEQAKRGGAWFENSWNV